MEHSDAQEEVKHLRAELEEERKKDQTITLAGACSSVGSLVAARLGELGRLQVEAIWLIRYPSFDAGFIHLT